MIQAENLTKRFDGITALDQLSTQIEDGCIYGLVGSNGAGKSTFLRLLAGIYQPTAGSVTIEGQPVYENYEIKRKIAFVPDDLCQLPGATMDSTALFLSGICPDWSAERYAGLLKHFPQPPSRRLDTCSKGMRRQAALILALSCMPKYLLLDEAFDGLDPVIRLTLRKVLADDVSNRGTTVLISSHNLRELEDVCDQVGLLHNGKILFQQDIEGLKLGFCKIQMAVKPMPPEQAFRDTVNLLSFHQTGSVAEIVARGSSEEVTGRLGQFSPLLCEAVPLTLEEVFIYEMEAVGYDYNNVIF